MVPGVLIGDCYETEEECLHAQLGTLQQSIENILPGYCQLRNSSTVSLFAISDDKSETRRDTKPSIMINPLGKGDETSAALAVVEATVGQKVRYHEL